MSTTDIDISHIAVVVDAAFMHCRPLIHDVVITSLLQQVSQ